MESSERETPSHAYSGPPPPAPPPHNRRQTQPHHQQHHPLGKFPIFYSHSIRFRIFTILANYSMCGAFWQLHGISRICLFVILTNTHEITNTKSQVVPLYCE